VASDIQFDTFELRTSNFRSNLAHRSDTLLDRVRSEGSRLTGAISTMVLPLFAISVLITIQHAPGVRYQIILAT
jgi:hypothetical protein